MTSGLVPPPAAAELFGPNLGRAESYVARLASAGVTRGLIGPREAPRLWERHLLNCALLADELPEGAEVLDVGSGAGLPGLVLAIRRPDLRVVLLEPMLRRTTFLEETVAELGLADRVRVVRGRAEDASVRRAIGGASWATARAVAPLDRLAGWCLPLLRPGGRLLALKGARAEEEARATQPAVVAVGGRIVSIHRLAQVSPGTSEVGAAGVEPTWVVVVERTGGERRSGREKRSR